MRKMPDKLTDDYAPSSRMKTKAKVVAKPSKVLQKPRQTKNTPRNTGPLPPKPAPTGWEVGTPLGAKTPIGKRLSKLARR